MILHCCEGRKSDRYYVEKGRRCISIYVDGDRAKFIAEENLSKYTGKLYFTLYLCKSRSAYTEAKHWSRDRISEYGNMLEVKKAVREYCEKHPRELKEPSTEGTVAAAYLPAGDNSDFYPTPDALAGKLIAGVDWKGVKDILEPSAGKGDLVEAVDRMREQHKYSEKIRGAAMGSEKFFDVIELDYNLRLILRGKGLRLVGDDFLQYRSQKRYDLIIMNPPFSAGAAHLLHAIELQQNGGQIACLLNAETIRNPYTNERKLLKKKLAEYGARIEFVKNGFRKAERKSDVEVAVIHINIPRPHRESTILEGAKKAVEKDYSDQRQDSNQIVIADEILSLIEYFNVEARAGIDFLLAYDALLPNIMAGTGVYAKPMIELKVRDREFSGASNETINEYLRCLRYKYWNLLLDKPQLKEKMTSQMQNDFHSKLRDMAEYDFDRHNVMQVFYDIQLQLQQGVEDSIEGLFSKLSEEHSWSRDINNDNVHYYNGWATNKAWKVGMKVILPINGFSSYSWKPDELDSYSIAGTISDMERTLTYLDKGEIGWQRDPYNVIRMANDMGTTRKELNFTYFTAKFYKKGTCHIKFRQEAAPIIDRLNIFAARKRSWLPPSYGRRKYEDMSEKEKAVIDDFQGREAYEKVMENPSHYVIEAAQLRPLLSA